MTSRPDRAGDVNIKAIHVFYAPLDIGGRLYRAKLTVKETKEGRLFYDHSLTKLESPAGVAAGDTASAAARQASTVGPQMNLTDLMSGVKWGEENVNPPSEPPPGDPGAAAGDQGGKPRAFPKKVDESPDVSDQVKAGLTARLYEPRSNETDAAAALRIIQERGIEAAGLAFRDEQNGMPGAVRTALGLQLVKQLGVVERAARAKGDRIAADEAVNQAVDLVAHAARRSTDVAQALQAMSMWARLTPAGHLRKYQRTITEAGQKVIEGIKPALDNILEILRKVNLETLQAVLGRKDLQDLARQAVNDRALEHPDTHTAVVVEVAGGLGESPEVLRQVREQVIGLFSKVAREAQGKGLWPRYKGGAVQNLVNGLQAALSGERTGRAMLDEFTKTVVKALRDQLNGAMGVKPGELVPPRSHFDRLMDLLSNPEKVQEVWAATREALRAARPDDPKVKALPALVDAFSPDILRGVIGEEMRAQGLDLAKLAGGHYQGADPGRTLRDKIITRTGMDSAGATRLAKALDAQFAKMVGEAKAKLAARLERQRQAQDLQRQSRSVWDREKEAASRELLTAVKARLNAKQGNGEPSTALQAFAGRLVARLRGQLLQTLPGRATGVAKLTDLQVLREAATNAEHYQEVWRQAQADIRAEFAKDPAALKQLDAALGKVAPELFAEGTVDRVLRQQMRAAQVDLGKVVKQHVTVVDATGKALAQKLVDEAGLSGEAAQRLANAFESRFARLAAERKRSELERVRMPIRLAMRGRKTLQERLIELSNLGAFSDQKFYDAIRERLGLPVWDPAVAKEIFRRANELQTTPEGFQQQRQIIDLQNYIARQSGLPWWDLPMSIWYANILSGPTTHILNMVGNVGNLTSLTALELGKAVARGDVGAVPQILTSLAEGFRKGTLEARAVLTSGMVTGTRLMKLEAAHGLELRQFAGWQRPLNAWKYVARAMGAEDLLVFKAAEEMRFALAARILARREGLSGEALARRVSDILGRVEERRTAAEAQAQREGLAGLDYRRRVEEILEQQRPAALRENAREFALRATFNQKPEGLLGAIAQAINTVSGRYPALRFIVPFTNIVANITNESLNYFPAVGGIRAIRGWWSGTLAGKPITDREALYDQTAKAALGLLGMTALGALHSQGAIEITGNGPADPNRRKQLMEAGWRPYSIRMGNRYYAIREPALIPLGILGNYFDAQEYRKLDDTDLVNRTAVALEMAGNIIVSQSFLSSLSGMFDWFQGRTTKQAGQGAMQTAARTAASFVVPNALAQVDRLFDPTVYDRAGVQATLVSMVPFVRRLNRPALNALGEPVTNEVLSRFVSKGKADELWQTLADKQAWISVPQRDQVIGDKSRGPDFYRTMTPDEYYDFVKDSGERIRTRLEANLARIQAMESPQAQALVQKIAEEEHTKAKKRFRP